MNQKKSSIDPVIKSVFLLKNLAFLLVLVFVFIFCCENIYDRVYGDNHYKNTLENLLKNGKTAVVDLNENYITTQSNIGNNYRNSYEFKYSFKVKDKSYDGVFFTEEFIPSDPVRLLKYMTVHYLPENPEVHQIDAELEYEYAKDTVEEHGIGMLLLNIFGLLLSFIFILYTIIIILDKIKNIDQPIENVYQQKQMYHDVTQKTNYTNLR